MAVSAVLGIALLLGAAWYASLAGYLWLRRDIPGAAGLAVCSMALGIWTVFYALELSSTTFEVARVWSGLKFIGIVLVPPGLWAFVLRYTAHTRPMPRRLVVLLLVQPVAIMTVIALPATHDLFHYYPALVGDPTEQEFVGSAPVPREGPLFWPHAIYTYVMLFAALALLVYRLARVARPYRRYSWLLIAASVLPFAGNVPYNLRMIGGVDPTPILFTITAIAFVWGMLRLRLLGILKVARAVVVDRLADAVLVIDAYGRIADINPAGEHLLDANRHRLIGAVLRYRVPELAAVIDSHVLSTTSHGDISLDDGAIDLAVQVTSLLQGGQETGRVVVLHDVTQRKAAERRVLDLLHEQTLLAETLQESLRPTSLPEVPGARLAARWVPAGVQGPLSGDFYDVHPAAGQGRWAFVFGDVVGKGVHAAVVTARARYAARALSAQGICPVDVMLALNEALLTEESERFCTVVYGLVDASGTGLDLRLVLGGHPPPLVRRRDGRVIQVGTPGMALGLTTPIQVHEARIRMEPGEILLAYTDGVTEARAPIPGTRRPSTEQFGDGRLSAVLAASPPVAEEVADAVLGAIEAFAVHRDDVALLVLEAT